MKVIVVGNGGREHTIAWKLAQSNIIEEVICVPETAEQPSKKNAETLIFQNANILTALQETMRT